MAHSVLAFNVLFLIVLGQLLEHLLLHYCLALLFVHSIVALYTLGKMDEWMNEWMSTSINEDDVIKVGLVDTIALAHGIYFSVARTVNYSFKTRLMATKII